MMKTFMDSPGSTTGFKELASSLMFKTSTPRSCATLLRLKSLVRIFELVCLASSIGFRSTSRRHAKTAARLSTHELGHHQEAVEKPRFADIGDAPVDDHAGIEDLAGGISRGPRTPGAQ